MSLEDIARQVNALLIELSRAESWQNLKKFLLESYTVYYDELIGKAHRWMGDSNTPS